MKNIYLLFSLLLICPNISFSQSYLDSADYSLSGSATLYYLQNQIGSNNDFTEKVINIAPTLSYFFYDRFSIGIELAYNYDGKTYQLRGDLSDINMYLSLGPMLKYYFFHNKISPFIKAGYQYDIYNLTEDYYYTRNSFHGYNTEFGIGVNSFFSQDFAGEASLDYVYTKKKELEFSLNAPSYVDANTKTIRLTISMLYFFR
jgi:Outer membrane protein beta-barrel domain